MIEDYKMIISLILFKKICRLQPLPIEMYILMYISSKGTASDKPLSFNMTIALNVSFVSIKDLVKEESEEALI